MTNIFAHFHIHTCEGTIWHNPNRPFLDVAVSSQFASKEFMSKFEPLASANRRLKEDKNDKEAQKMYDEYFPMALVDGRDGRACQAYAMHRK